MRLTALVMLLLTGCSDPPPPPRDLWASAKIAIEAENYSRAEKVFTELIARDQASFDAFIGRASVRIFLGDSAGCQADFRAATALNAENGPKACFYSADRAVWKARGLTVDGKHGDALKIYDVLLSLYPKSGTAFHDRGAVKIDMRDYEGAIADLTGAIEFDEGNNSCGDSYSLRARAKREKGDTTGAAEDEKLAATASASARTDSR